MKKIFVISLLILSIFFISCSAETTDKTFIPETSIVTVTSIIEVEDTQKIKELEEELKEKQEDIEKYNDLINSLNKYLSYVYLIRAENANYTNDGFGFVIKYNDMFYFITAGHVVHYVYDDLDILCNSFKYFDGNWKSLKLLDYNNDFYNREDYAIFTNSKLNDGFDVDIENDNPKFIVNDNRLISGYKYKIIEGESGSPVIDLDGEVTHIATTDVYSCNTDMDIVLEAINNLK